MEGAGCGALSLVLCLQAGSGMRKVCVTHRRDQMLLCDFDQSGGKSTVVIVLL